MAVSTWNAPGWRAFLRSPALRRDWRGRRRRGAVRLAVPEPWPGKPEAWWRARSRLAEQVHDEAGDGELRADERGGLNPQGAVEVGPELGESAFVASSAWSVPAARRIPSAMASAWRLSMPAASRSRVAPSASKVLAVMAVSPNARVAYGNCDADIRKPGASTSIPFISNRILRECFILCGASPGRWQPRAVSCPAAEAVAMGQASGRGGSPINRRPAPDRPEPRPAAPPRGRGRPVPPCARASAAERRRRCSPSRSC